MSERNKDAGRDYSCYDRMSTAELEQLLRLDFQASRDGESDLDAILYISQLLAQRSGSAADSQAAWDQFQTKYRPYADGRSLYEFDEEDAASNQAPAHVPARPRPRGRQPRRPGLKRAAILAALLIAGLVGGMAVAQAAGLDLFNAMARWTDEVFHFVSPTSQPLDTEVQGEDPAAGDPYATLRDVMVEEGIDESLLPTWYPDGFFPTETEISSTNLGDTVHTVFLHEDGRFFSLTITQCDPGIDVGEWYFEKDDTSVETYSNDWQTFYLLSNLDTMTAVWSNGTFMEQLDGTLSRQEFEQIIDSIPGPSQ